MAGPSDVPGSFKALVPKFQLDKKKGIKSSNFIITLNTNVRFESSDSILETLSGPLYEMSEKVFGRSESLSEIVQFGRRGPRGSGGGFTFLPNDDTWNPGLVVDFRTTAGVEIGHNSMGKRLHLHVALKIRHRSYIRLDRDLIFQKVNQELEAQGFPYPIKHLNIRVTPPTAEDYLDK